jgi:hypothetical protein
MEKTIDEFYNYEVPEYVKGAGKSFIKINVSDFRGSQVLKIRMIDVVEYYKTQANNIVSGMRSIAGFAGDWRNIDEIAKECLDYFKFVNIDALRRLSKKEGLEPKF